MKWQGNMKNIIFGKLIFKKREKAKQKRKKEKRRIENGNGKRGKRDKGTQRTTTCTKYGKDFLTIYSEFVRLIYLYFCSFSI
jgi:hypothetical protein